MTLWPFKALYIGTHYCNQVEVSFKCIQCKKVTRIKLWLYVVHLKITWCSWSIEPCDNSDPTNMVFFGSSLYTAYRMYVSVFRSLS